MAINRVERILLAIGLSLLAVWVAARFHGRFGSQAAIRQFAAENPRALADAVPSSLELTLDSPVDFRLWSGQRISAYKDSLTKKTDAPLAILRIPKIDVVVPVFNDTDELTLNRGVGRIVGTAQVGQPGNLGIAGHRDGFFRGLQSVGQGDVIELVRPGSTDKYFVTAIQVVSPEDTYVLEPTSVPTLTLVTCFPFYFVGHAPKRYIVTAVRKGTNEQSASADLETSFAGKNEKN